MNRDIHRLFDRGHWCLIPEMDVLNRMHKITTDFENEIREEERTSYDMFDKVSCAILPIANILISC